MLAISQSESKKCFGVAVLSSCRCNNHIAWILSILGFTELKLDAIITPQKNEFFDSMATFGNTCIALVKFKKL